MYNTNIKAQTLLIEGKEYNREILPKGTSPIMNDLRAFLSDWFNDDQTINVHTSGSTGMPKTITVRKEQMMQSACLTCSFFNLYPGDKVLLCMPLSYIAGKMMVVRALVGQLDMYIVEPNGHPLANVTETFRFVPMIPLQVFNSLQVPEERSRLENIEQLLLGGGAISLSLEKKLSELPIAVYLSYGMTETVSHIALRRINGPDASLYYKPLPSVKLSLTVDDTLVIDAPLVCDKKLYTNDRAIIYPDGSFEILGRVDNMINSGGIKIQIEKVEEAIRPLLTDTYAVTSVPHPKFGEAIVLLVQEHVDKTNLLQRMEALLPPYHSPKKILEVKSIPLTASGKINRYSVRQLAISQINFENIT